MRYLATGLLALAYILAVVDGVMADGGTYPSDSGRTGVRYVREHPWIVAGAACGVAGTVVGVT